MIPPCCVSPSHISALPPYVEAGLSVVALLVVAWAFAICWAWMASPMARHASRTCGGRWGCQLCVDEERNARVDEYVAHAKQRRATRLSAALSLKSKESEAGR